MKYTKMVHRMIAGMAGGDSPKIYRMPGWLLLIIVLVVAFVVISVLSSVVSMLLPIIIPVFCVVLIVRMLRKGS